MPSYAPKHARDWKRPLAEIHPHREVIFPKLGRFRIYESGYVEKVVTMPDGRELPRAASPRDKATVLELERARVTGTHARV